MPQNYDQQFKSTCRNFITYDILKKTFYSLVYIDFMQIEGYVNIYCSDLKQTHMHVQAYHHFFKNNIKAKINYEKIEEHDRNIMKHPNLPFDGYDWFRKKLKRKIPKKDHICTSLISVDKHEKGITKEQKEALLSCFGEKIINIGDSRNFSSTNEVIDKLTILAESKCFIGSSTSYSHMAPIFDTPSIHINSFWPYRGERLWTHEFLCDTVNGTPIGYVKQ